MKLARGHPKGALWNHTDFFFANFRETTRQHTQLNLRPGPTEGLDENF
jgi:hypothetical protein